MTARPSRARRAALGLACAVAVGLCAAPGAVAANDDITIFDASSDALGHRGAAERESAFDDLDSLGVDSMRLLVWWRDVAPGPGKLKAPPGFHARDSNTYGPGGSRWAAVDAAVRLAAARGIGVYLVPSGGPTDGLIPRWASLTPKRGADNPDPAEFGTFLQAIGQRYRGDFDPDGAGPEQVLPAVGTMGVYNEPNNGTYLLPQRRHGKLVSGKRYRALFKAARSGLAAAGWDGRVLMGETSPQGVKGNPGPITFLRGALCLNRKYKRRKGCRRLNADGWAHHPYALSYAPWEKPPGGDRVSIGSLGKLTRALKKAGRARALPRGLPLYVTEFGYQSKPDRLLGLPLRRHAEYLAISEWIAHKNHRVASYAQYLLHDDPSSYGAAGFQSGLRFADGKAKPAFAGFRLPLAARLKKGGVRLWGRVRPATGVTTVKLRVRDRKGRARKLRRVRTNAFGYFHLRANYKRGRRFGVAWEGQKGPLIGIYRW